MSREFKSTLANLLQGMDELNQRSQEREIVLQNYTATIRQIGRGADSIISVITFSERPPSPSPKISLLGTSIGSDPSTGTIKFSQMGPGSSSLDSRSTYQTAPAYRSTDTEMQMEPSTDPMADDRSTPTMKPPSNSWIPGQCPQIFVKGLGRTTIVLRLPMCLSRCLVQVKLPNLSVFHVLIRLTFLSLILKNRRLGKRTASVFFFRLQPRA